MSDSMTPEAGSSEQQLGRPYVPPMVIPIGNLYQLVAGTSQNLLCDGLQANGDGNKDTGC